MRYTIRENAVNSLDIATNYFRKIDSENRRPDLRFDNFEKIKIAIIFLENSIELLLKSLLIEKNPNIIYKNNMKNFKRSKSKAMKKKYVWRTF